MKILIRISSRTFLMLSIIILHAAHPQSRDSLIEFVDHNLGCSEQTSSDSVYSHAYQNNSLSLNCPEQSPFDKNAFYNFVFIPNSDSCFQIGLVGKNMTDEGKRKLLGIRFVCTVADTLSFEVTQSSEESEKILVTKLRIDEIGKSLLASSRLYFPNESKINLQAHHPTEILLYVVKDDIWKNFYQQYSEYPTKAPWSWVPQNDNFQSNLSMEIIKVQLCNDFSDWLSNPFNESVVPRTK